MFQCYKKIDGNAKKYPNSPKHPAPRKATTVPTTPNGYPETNLMYEQIWEKIKRTSQRPRSEPVSLSMDGRREAANGNGHTEKRVTWWTISAPRSAIGRFVISDFVPAKKIRGKKKNKRNPIVAWPAGVLQACRYPKRIGKYTTNIQFACLPLAEIFPEHSTIRGDCSDFK